MSISSYQLIWRGWIVVMLGLLLAGCRTGTVETETASATVTPSQTATLLPTKTPTITTTPLPRITLPAPVYYLSEASGAWQIWRLEADGVSYTQVTNEEAGIEEFDVSRMDNQLVYVTGTQLVLTDGDGQNRQMLLEGAVYTPEGYAAYYDAFSAWRFMDQISDPTWSPDGTQIAFSQGGANIISKEGGQVVRVLKSDDYYLEDVFETGDQSWEGVTFFAVRAWSPDGGSLLLDDIAWERKGFTILDLATLSRSECSIYAWCGEPYWVEGRNSLLIIGSPIDDFGLQIGDPGGGTIEQVWPAFWSSGDDQIPVYVSLPIIVGDSLYALSNITMPTTNQSGPYPLVRANVDGSNASIVTEVPFHIWEGVWAPDGSGLLVVIKELNQFRESPAGMAWIPTDGSAPFAVDLPMMTKMKWGR